MEWIMVDIETSGLDPHLHEPIEVALVSSQGEELDFSLPFDLIKADPRALEVNGWGQRQFAPPLQHSDALELVSEWFEDGAFIVAAPAHFDVGFLEAWFRRNEISVPWSHRKVIDMKSYAQGKIGGPLDGFSNSAIADMVGLAPIEKGLEHTALGDAKYQAEVFKRLVEIRWAAQS